MTTSARTAVVEFQLTTDTVEAWIDQQLVAVFDRNRLQTWLDEPSGWLAEGTVMFSVEPHPDRDRITITVPDALPWVLSPAQHAALRHP